MQIGKTQTPVTSISQAYPGPRRGTRTRSLRRPDGEGELHRVLPPTAHRSRADRRRALLSRPAPRGDRGARDDAEQRGGADDARSRPGVAPGSRGGGNPGSGLRRPRHFGGVCPAPRRGPGTGGIGRRTLLCSERIRADRPRCRRQGARIRPSGASTARPTRRADSRARRCSRRERDHTFCSRARSGTPWGRLGASRSR